MVAGMGNAVVRIREPHPNDVLCGRGGSINNHIGNKRFREWVHERKNDYNLASNKAEKARVSGEVMDLVKEQDPPGRFLTRDPDASSMSGPAFWIEIDDGKAMAKTSQALREGAPSIRAQHKDELDDRKQRGTTKRTYKRVAESGTPMREPPAESMPPPPVVAMSNEMAVEALKTAAEAAKLGLGAPVDDTGIRRAVVSNAEMQHEHPTKKARIMERVTSETETPPLMPMSGDDAKPFISLSGIDKADNLKRAHSLALSDINDGDLEFVNPFEDESDYVNQPKHPANYLYRSSGESNHSVGHMSFSSLPKLSNSDLSKHRNRSSGTNGTPLRKTVSSRSVSIDKGTTGDESASSKNCFCECGSPLEEGRVCPCGALADHLVWRDDHIQDEDWLHIAGFMDQIVPVSP